MTSRYAQPRAALTACGRGGGETAHMASSPQEIRRSVVGFLQEFQYFPVPRRAGPQAPAEPVAYAVRARSSVGAGPAPGGVPEPLPWSISWMRTRGAKVT